VAGAAFVSTLAGMEFVSAAAGAGALLSAAGAFVSAGAALVSVLAVELVPALLQPVMTRGRAIAARHKGRMERDFID
jgi:hypothetical protein